MGHMASGGTSGRTGDHQSGAGLVHFKNTKHDLSFSSTGATVKASSSTYPGNEICIFCHIPHNANPAVPLWNHKLSSQTYILYTSSTLNATLGQPDGSSKLCLSCHDGTVAIGGLNSMTVAMSGVAADGTMPATASDLGTDLRDDHPVSFVPKLPDPDNEILPPPAGDPVKLDAGGKVQCTSCHDPHDNAIPPFLKKASVATTYGGALCLTCHNKSGWNQGAHRNATTKNYNGRLGTKTVAAYACESCHAPHSATEPQRLLHDGNPSATVEEAVCYPCHNGTVATKNIQSEFAQQYKHPVADKGGVHQPNENYNLMSPRHVECADCHNPHSAKVDSTPPTRPNLWGSLTNVWGVGVTYGGTAWSPPSFTPKIAQYEFEICFKCHSSYSYGANPPVSPSSGVAQTDLSVQFNPNNLSYHLVGIPGAVNRTVYGGKFVPPWTKDSVLYCSDCHGGTGTVAGPHGSSNPFLLVAPWNEFTGRSGYDTRDHLCFKCHDYDYYTGSSSFSERSDFSSGGSGNLHRTQGHGRIYGCQACHSRIPHGMNHPGLLAVKGVDPDRYAQYSYLKINTWGSAGNWPKSYCNHGAQAGGCRD